MDNKVMTEVDPIEYAKIYMQYNRHLQAFEVISENWNTIKRENHIQKAKEILKECLSKSKDSEFIMQIKNFLSENFSEDFKEMSSVVQNTQDIEKYKYMLSILMENDYKTYSYPTRAFVEIHNAINTQEGLEEINNLYKNKNWALLSYIEIKKQG